MNLLPSRSVLMTIAWTLGTLAVLNRFPQTRMLIRGPNGG